MIILDTSGVIAAYNRREGAHIASHEILARAVEPLVISPLVLAEVDYLATKYLGTSSATIVLTELERTATIATFANEDLQRATELLTQYSDLNIGLTDAANVVIAGRYKATKLLTLDGHYRVVRPLYGDAFDILPS